KHMGSRAVVIACRDEAAVRERFGVTTGELGIVYTRTGRRFFNADFRGQENNQRFSPEGTKTRGKTRLG
ncbi:MAG: hypothetical protein JO122_21545, partial [Acetobacteraceae bacterium]|nr:hypothetical protein [Acetobacteraceae bacterium]